MQTSVKQYAAEVQHTQGVPIQMRVGFTSARDDVSFPPYSDPTKSSRLFWLAVNVKRSPQN
jgi:hypothetical protein